MKRGYFSKTAALAARGFAIGCADLVPGVSGGTVALVTGIYPRLVAAISTGAASVGRLIRGDLRGAISGAKQVEWRFLLPVIVGAGAAVATMASLVEDLLHQYPIRMAAVFFGLIAGSVIVAWHILRAPAFRHLVIALAIGTSSFVGFGLRRSVVGDPDWYLFLGAGALAICAFILPGVSGSFLLLAIGMYQQALSVVSDLRVGPLLVFALGAAVGLGLFSRLLQWLLDGYHDLVVAAMIGLMIGSFRILWPWPAGLGNEEGAGATVLGMPGSDVAVPVALATVSALAVIGFATWAARKTP